MGPMVLLTVRSQHWNGGTGHQQHCPPIRIVVHDCYGRSTLPA